MVGSGIAADRLTDDAAVTLIANTAATVGGLVALILAFAPISAAHLNPVVTAAERLTGRLPTRDAIAYVAAQVGGGVAGTAVANLMFDLAPLTASGTQRSSGGLWLGEAVATFGLLTLILLMSRSGNIGSVAFAVGGFIGAGYWFTSSTSFANPAVTVARSLTDTFAGISPASVPAFIAAQLVGAAIAITLARYLLESSRA